MPTEKTRRWEDLDKLLINLTMERRPETVQQLVEMINKRFSYREDEIIERISVLQDERRLSLLKTKETFPTTFTGYILSGFSSWFWFVVIFAVVTALLVVAIPDNAFPFAYARYGLGLVYLLFIPGYCFVRAIFVNKEISVLEQLAVSLGLSILLVFLMGLLLNYSPWGIGLTPIVISFLFVTLLFSLVAVFRNYKTEWRKPGLP